MHEKRIIIRKMFQAESIPYVITGFLAIVTIYYLLIRKKNITTRTTHENISKEAKKIEAPKLEGAWPIIGHLHLFRSNDLLHRKLGAMADKLGPVFVMRLGMHPVLVISDWEIAKECFTTKDRIFANRPSMVAGKHMGYGNLVLALAPFGAYWREVRKIATVELLSNHRLHLLRHVRVSEIDASIKQLHQLCMNKLKKGSTGEHSVEVDLTQWFKALTLNIIVRIIAGKRYCTFGEVVEDEEQEEARQWKKTINELMYLLGMFVVGDAIPHLRGVDVQGHERAMRRTGKDMDAILSKWVEQHRRKKKVIEKGDNDEQDFIDVMLNTIKDDSKIFDHDANKVVKAICLALVSGGSDTTMLSLTWAMSLLLNNRGALEKAQAELDNQIGRSKEQVEEEDIKKLPYLQAIVKETLRLYPVSPLSAPHEAMEDCTIAGFYVPKGTRLITNIWKLQRDPRVWEDPLEFRPERFLASDHHGHVDFRGQQFEFIPFGSGRRMCPGISFATGILHLTLARLLHEFQLGTPNDAPIDMTENPGVTMQKANPLHVLLVPRITSTAY